MCVGGEGEVGRGSFRLGVRYSSYLDYDLRKLLYSMMRKRFFGFRNAAFAFIGLPPMLIPIYVNK